MFLTEGDAGVWDERASWYETGTVGSMVNSMSSWFSSLGVSAEGAYYNKGTSTMMEAEDPEYLEVVDYFMGLEGETREKQSRRAICSIVQTTTSPVCYPPHHPARTAPALLPPTPLVRPCNSAPTKVQRLARLPPGRLRCD